MACNTHTLIGLVLSIVGSSAFAQSLRVESILPSTTDLAITSWNAPHVAAFDPIVDQRGQLFVYLHGQGGTAGGSTELIKTAAALGYHAVGITYPNDWGPFALCNSSTDSQCAENLRREIVEGVDYSPLISVSRTNSLENRLIKLLLHLNTIHPGEGWNEYLDQNSSIRWDRVAVWGHSQGGGNAGVIAHDHALARVCFSAPASDGNAASPASWWANPATPISAYFGICHTQDGLNAKVAFWNALGMGEFGAVVDVAAASPPYANTHELSASIAPAVAGQYHNSVALDSVRPRLADNTPAYTAAWQYMLTAPTDSVSAVAPSLDDAIVATVPTFDGTTQIMLDLRGALAGSGPRPLLVWIHGGGWQSGSHNQMPASAADLRSQGISVASIGYRLSGQATFPAQIHDCKAAIRWLRAHADELQIDPTRVAVWGSSAGGHFACLVATSGNEPLLEGDVGGNTEFSSAVIAAGVYFGPSDILQMQPDCSLQAVGCSGNHDAPDSAESKLLGVVGPSEGLAWLRANIDNPVAPFPQLAQLARDVNPITHLDPADPPMYIAHGDRDTTVPLNQSVRVRDAATSMGVEVVYEVAPGFGHGFLGDEVNARVAAWIADQLLNVETCPECAADFDFNGGVDGGDLAAFFGDFEQGLPCADVDGNGGVDGGDLGLFFTLFEAGGC